MPKPLNDLHFEIDSWVVFQLGEQLVTDVVQAIVELVKNRPRAVSTSGARQPFDPLKRMYFGRCRRSMAKEPRELFVDADPQCVRPDVSMMLGRITLHPAEPGRITLHLAVRPTRPGSLTGLPQSAPLESSGRATLIAELFEGALTVRLLRWGHVSSILARPGGRIPVWRFAAIPT